MLLIAFFLYFSHFINFLESSNSSEPDCHCSLQWHVLLWSAPPEHSDEQCGHMDVWKSTILIWFFRSGIKLRECLRKRGSCPAQRIMWLHLKQQSKKSTCTFHESDDLKKFRTLRYFPKPPWPMVCPSAYYGQRFSLFLRSPEIFQCCCIPGVFHFFVKMATFYEDHY